MFILSNKKDFTIYQGTDMNLKKITDINQLLKLSKQEDITSILVENWEGIGKDLTEEDVDPEELRMGIEVEMEHTNNQEVAKRIALDHLQEIENYYTLLMKMEKDAIQKDKNYQ